MPKRLITHSETFHTDDVFATALLLEIFPDAEVIRSRDDQVIASGDIVYDVGRIYDPGAGRFDHHQADAAKRENGITYCGFGLLWKEYGERYCNGDAEAAAIIDRKLVMPIDANDNGQAIVTPMFEGLTPFTIDSIISIYNPLVWLNESETPDDQFFVAVQIASRILRRIQISVQNDLAAQKAFMAEYQKSEDKRTITMDKPVSVREILEDCPELLYLISPRPDKTWGVLAVADRADSYTPRRAFPEQWRSLSGKELVEVSGVDDAVFCHATGFLAVARSREGGLVLARRSLGELIGKDVHATLCSVRQTE